MENDLILENNDLALDKGLQTKILVSLFTDRRVGPKENLEDPMDLRGWWAKENFGSRLWLLRRAKATKENLLLAKSYAQEALHWLVEKNLCEQVLIHAYYTSLNQIQLDIEVWIKDQKQVYPMSFKTRREENGL